MLFFFFFFFFLLNYNTAKNLEFYIQWWQKLFATSERAQKTTYKIVKQFFVISNSLKIEPKSRNRNWVATSLNKVGWQRLTRIRFEELIKNSLMLLYVVLCVLLWCNFCYRWMQNVIFCCNTIWYKIITDHPFSRYFAGFLLGNFFW
jgi:hypothetical protein